MAWFQQPSLVNGLKSFEISPIERLVFTFIFNFRYQKLLLFPILFVAKKTGLFKEGWHINIQEVTSVT